MVLFKTTLGPLLGKLVLFYSLLQKCDLAQKHIDKFNQVMDLKCSNESLIQTVTGGILMKLKKWKEASCFYQYTSRAIIKLYENDKIRIDELLRWYKDLLRCQKETGDYEKAMKTFQQIKICDLNSPDPNDVMLYFDKNVKSMINTSRKSGINLYDQRQNNKTLMVFGDICQLKFEIYNGLGDLVQRQLWAELPLQIFSKIHFNLNVEHKRIIPKNTEYHEYFDELSKSTISRLINTCLNLAEKQPDLDLRKICFEMLFERLFLEKQNPAQSIKYATDEFSINVGSALTFLKFFTTFCDSKEGKEELDRLTIVSRERFNRIPCWSLEDAKKSINIYKNSLLINNHFRKSFQ